jgi:phenol 2-monooxygenase
MQFHLNGFVPGDPDVRPPADDAYQPELPEALDVLIVGSGPAGLVLAAQLSQFPGIRTRIVERRAGRLIMGQADGIACRTVEMFHAFGLSERLLREAYWVNQTVFWRPAPKSRKTIMRTGRVQDTEEGLSEFPHVIINQARIQDFLLETMHNSTSRLTPDYNFELTGITRDDSQQYPIAATLRKHGGNDDGREFTVRARYLVGCDGARSAVRNAIGLELRGDAANHAWGVMDVLATTDFPDIRFKAAIQSADKGNLLLIPREGGHLVRFYVDLGVVTLENRSAIRQTTAEQIAAIAREILSPYTLDIKETVWWSVYEVGQRLTERFDDASSDTREPRVFIAGDACHTHSAKAGQGMNVSMQDAFNLGWKLAAVLENRSPVSLLRTYSQERQPVAQELIDFDKEWSAMMGAAPKDPSRPGTGGVDPSVLQSYFVKAGRYTAGVATRYCNGTQLTGAATYQTMAAGLQIGMRFHSAPVIRVADGKPVHLGHCGQADGRWRLYIFADAKGNAVDALCDQLQHSADSPVHIGNMADGDLDQIFDVRMISQNNHADLDISTLPALLRPCKGRYGLIDYEKVFAPCPGDDIFDTRQVNRETGAMILVRPDQFVAHVLPLEGYIMLSEFMRPLLSARAH